jgi:glycosyltransferase involved in cell wall biosynthesis
MALGVVPVVMNVGDLSDYAIQGETGYIHDDADVSAFVQSLMTLLSDEYKRKSMAETARKSVLESCDREILAERWGNIITNIVNKKDR